MAATFDRSFGKALIGALENYTQRAQAQNATLEQYALTQGCILIARTQPGEKYQAPDGSWQTRGTGPALRDPRCP